MFSCVTCFYFKLEVWLLCCCKSFHVLEVHDKDGLLIYCIAVGLLYAIVPIIIDIRFFMVALTRSGTKACYCWWYFIVAEFMLICFALFLHLVTVGSLLFPPFINFFTSADFSYRLVSGSYVFNLVNGIMVEIKKLLF